MKNKPLAIAALLSAFVFGSATGQERIKRERNPEQTQKRVEKLRNDLSLTDAQYEKLLELEAEKKANSQTKRSKMNKGKRGEDDTQKLKEELKLTDKQAEQIKALRKRQAAEMKAFRTEMKEKKAAYENEFKGILDENQRKQWEEKKQDFRRPNAKKRSGK